MKTKKERYITYWRHPTEFEIKNGYGAIHYRDFLLSDVLKDGKPKKWFKDKIDGLRYNY